LKIIAFTFLLFAADQISKMFVKGFSLPWLNINHNGFNPGDTTPLINNFFHITLVENPGIAFGIIPGDVLKELILILTIIICLALFGFLVFAKNADTKVRFAVGLILGGAGGNLFDRIFYGYIYNYAPLFQGHVVDFLDLKLFKIFLFGQIPGNYVFNFADLSITLGIIVLISLIMKAKKEELVLVKQFAKERQDSY